jgi:tRNA-intron endonuclease
MFVVSMSRSKIETAENSEIKIRSALEKNGVGVSRKENADELSSRGYGRREKDKLVLTFDEALYLMNKGLLEVEDEKGRKLDFQAVLQCYEAVEENAWARYLAYRDLRSRGYVVREGFGSGVDFRVYERGEYSKDTAKYLIVSIQEGKPVSLENLANVLKQCQSLKKELVLAVMNRRGETVYYSVSQLNLP